MQGKRWKSLFSLSLILGVLSVGVLAAVMPASSITVTWSQPQRLTRSIDYDYNPAIIQTSDSKVWVFWEVAPNDPIGPPPIPDIVYKTYDWSTWSSVSGNLSAGGSAVQTLVNSSAQDVLPSVAQMKNGTLYLSFASDRSGNFDIYLKKYNPSSGWSSDIQITTNPDREETSSLVAASDGSLWVFWDRRSSTGNTNIYYKKYNGGGWTSESALTTDSSPILNRQPSAFQTKDGKIWVMWSQVQDTGLKKVYIYYKTYDGVSWSTPKQHTSTGPDRHPEILQAADSTIWTFWNREMPLPGNCYQEDLFYKTSTDNGVTWSVEAQLTNDQAISQCNNDTTPDDIGAAAVQLRDFKVWVFWQSDRDPEGWWDLYYASSNAFPVHDVAVTDLSATPLLLRRGGPVTIIVRVENLGGYSETFTLTVLATNTTAITLATRTVTLASGASQSFTITWDTSTVNPARYKISASIPAVSGESTQNQANNTLNDGTVHLVPPGDVNMDGKVDIIDASTLALAYGSTAGPPPSPTWNPNADLDGNGRVDIVDAATLALWYGTSG